MRRSTVELLVVALMALPIGAHGLSALLSHRLWVSPKHSKPYEILGAPADLMGLAWLSMAACLFAVWLAIRGGRRKLGIGLVAGFACLSVGAFVASLWLR